MICHINLAKSFRGGERQTALLVNTLPLPQKVLLRRGSPLKAHIQKASIQEISKPFWLHLPRLKSCRLIHAHEAKGAQLAFLAHLLYGTPYVLTRRVLFEIKQNPFTQAIYANAAAVIAISNAVAERVKSQTEAKNIHLLPSALTPLATTKELPKLLERFKDRFVVLNIAALKESDKGQLDILQAAKRLPDVTFLLVGEGPDEQMLKSKAPSNVIFEGFRSNIADYLQIADIFLFPSRTEGLGSILLDAMAASKPIITRPVGGIVDLVDERSALFANSPEQIVQAIQKLRNNPALAKELAQEAKRRTAQYRIELLAPKIEQIYQRILDENLAH